MICMKYLDNCCNCINILGFLLVLVMQVYWQRGGDISFDQHVQFNP